MTEKQPDKRMNAILGMLESIASLDFSNRLTISSKADNIDAVASGLNMLSEELRANVVERSMLKEINDNLERFAYTAAHDMKSPLNAATGLINLIEHELDEKQNKQISQELALLKETMEQLKRLINGILDYSRISFSNLQMQEIDLGTICKDITNRYRSNKQVVINIDEKMPVVDHYETALTQIISNLLSNAVRYNDKKICKIEIKCIEKPDHYLLSIADNGPGIKEENQEKIFDLFENLRTKRDESTGIGLATVKKAVTETDGRVWVESREDQGAKFVFTMVKKNKK